MRVGTCYARMLDSFFPVRPYKLARYATKPLRQFGRSGLPCRSHLIARGVAESGIRALKKRPSELIIRPCYRPCPAPKDSYVTSITIPFRRRLVVMGGRLPKKCCRPQFSRSSWRFQSLAFYLQGGLQPFCFIINLIYWFCSLYL